MLQSLGHSIKILQYPNSVLVIKRMKHLETSQNQPHPIAPTANMGQDSNRGCKDGLRPSSRITSSLVPHESSEISEPPESVEASEISDASEPPRRSGRMRTPSTRLDASESLVMSRQNVNSVAPSPAGIQSFKPKPANQTTGQC